MANKVDHAKLVTLWKQNKTTDEIARDLGVSSAVVYAASKKLRDAGVKLPKRTRPNEVIDVDGLNKLLAE